MMLPLPQNGMERSVKKDNIDPATLCDWLEACALFGNEDFSRQDVADRLHDEDICPESDLAESILKRGWEIIQRRQRWLGTGRYVDVQGPRLAPMSPSWTDRPAQAFCLALSLIPLYTDWGKAVRDPVGQGELFERLTQESLAATGWTAARVGWSPDQPGKLPAVVERVAVFLVESHGVHPATVNLFKEKNEAGLDVVAHRPFPDGRGGTTPFLFQCASGDDWRDKVSTPRIDLWSKFIEFSGGAVKAFAMPFAPATDDDHRRYCHLVSGLAMDRFRLLAPVAGKTDWPSAELRRDLADWLGPRVDKLVPKPPKARKRMPRSAPTHRPRK